MTKSVNGVYASEVAYIATSEYLGGQYIALAGASVAATIPTGTKMVLISAEGGAAYYAVNATGETPAASDESPGYVPADNIRFVYPVSNLSTIHVFGAAGAKARLEYYSEG